MPPEKQLSGQSIPSKLPRQQHCWGSVKWWEATAGYANISLHSHGFSVVLSVWQIQVLLFGTFWIFLIFFFFFWIFLICRWVVESSDTEDQLYSAQLLLVAEWWYVIMAKCTSHNLLVPKCIIFSSKNQGLCFLFIGVCSLCIHIDMMDAEVVCGVLFHCFKHINNLHACFCQSVPCYKINKFWSKCLLLC